MEVSLQNKTILVTGGTGGLGQAFVDLLSDLGARVLFTFCSQEEKSEQLQTNGAHAFHLDLSSRDSQQEFIHHITKEYTSLDGIIHNAGVSLDHTLGKFPEQDFDASMEINLTSVFLLTKALYPLLKKSKLAKVVNVTSRNGVRGNFGQAAYSASKAGLIALTKSMAEEWGEDGILVNAITPGYVMSDMTEKLPQSILDKAKRESYTDSISDAQEVAKLVAYMMSDHVTKLTGQLWHYDTRKN